MVNHIINDSNKLVQKEYKTKNDWMEKVIDSKMYKRYNFDHQQPRIRPLE